jgi:hypothetical protein
MRNYSALRHAAIKKAGYPALFIHNRREYLYFLMISGRESTLPAETNFTI